MDKQEVRLYRHMRECERFIRVRYNMWHSRADVLSEYTTMSIAAVRFRSLNCMTRCRVDPGQTESTFIGVCLSLTMLFVFNTVL